MSVAQRRPPYYLGIDLGGTAIKSGVVDDTGQPLSSVSLPTEAIRGPDVGLQNMAEAGRQAVAESGLSWGDLAAVGLGSPGDMDIPAGVLLDPPNLPGWQNLPIRDRLADLLGMPIVFQNDGNAAAFGEYWVGAGRGMESMALFTLGTGIGCGIIDHGRIIAGRHSHGSECGHLIIQAIGGREHPPGYFGRLEAYASRHGPGRARGRGDRGRRAHYPLQPPRRHLNGTGDRRAFQSRGSARGPSDARDRLFPGRRRRELDAYHRPGHRPSSAAA